MVTTGTSNRYSNPIPSAKEVVSSSKDVTAAALIPSFENSILALCLAFETYIPAPISVLVNDVDENGNIVKVLMKETSVGRVIVNEIVPDKAGYINTIISKKSLRDIISRVIKACGVSEAAEFLDGIKNLGYQMAFKGGLSFNLGDIIIPKEKSALVQRGYEEVEQVINNYNMGFITNNERYNQVIDIGHMLIQSWQIY